MPAKVISTEAAGVENGIHLDYFTSEVALEESEIRSTDPDIPMDNNYMHNELHFQMPWGCVEYNDEGDEIDNSDAIPTSSWRRQAATALSRFDLGSSDVDGYEGNNMDHADADKEEEASQSNDGLTQNLED